MPDQESFDSLAAERHIDQLCDQFEAAWEAVTVPSIEVFLQDAPNAYRTHLLEELIGIDVEIRRARGLLISEQDYLARFPEFGPARIHSLLDRTVANVSPKTLPADATLPAAESEQPSSDDSTESLQKIHYFGDYELLERIARGGMGTVYRARQITLNRIVAVKMINSGKFASRDLIQRFYSEAEAAASLDHPHIVPVYEVGEHNSEHFFSMAYIEGSSLEARLKEGPMEPVEAADLLQKVASAVQFAHDRGVIHRDLKPSNILIDQSGRPRVSDFGLAKRLADESGLTVSGEVLGTPSFMPPEQAAGKVNVVDFTSDVYSLGAVLYACLAGRPPFQAASHVATLKQVIDQEPVQLRQLNSSIPRDLETITHKCLEKSMARRYASPQALADDLQRFRDGLPILARPISTAERGVRWCQRHPARALNAAALILLVLGSTVGWLLYRAHDRELMAQAEAASLVEQLNLARDASLPLAVQQARAQPRTLKLLQDQFQNEPRGSQLKNRAAIGLLPKDPAVVGELCDALPELSWSEWSFFTQELAPFAQHVDRWRATKVFAPTDNLTDSHLLRVAATVAWLENLASSFKLTDNQRRSFDPHTSDNIQRIANATLIELYRDPTQLRDASEALKPLRAELGPALAKKLEYTQPSGALDSSIAASLLAKLFHDEPISLFELSALVRSDALQLLFANVTNSDELRRHLRQAIQKAPVQEGSWELQNLERRKIAVAGLALALLGDFDPVWPILSHRADASVRSLLIEWLPHGATVPAVVMQKTTLLLDARAAHLESLAGAQNAESVVPNPWLFDDVSSQLRACVQILGNCPAELLNRHAGQAFWESIGKRLNSDPDPGLHAACEWLLRQQQRQSAVNSVNSAGSNPTAIRLGWQSTANGHRMVMLQGPIEFVAGADKSDPNRDAGETIDPVDKSKEIWSEDHTHPKYIPRSFAIAAYETRFAQVQEFDPDFHRTQNKTLGNTLQHPACKVTWYQAAAYCNWLSEKEGIDQDQWCFVPNAAGKYAEGMSLAPDYLQRTGYRLPTEAEWEYACRAGTTTRRYFGETDELINRYVWYMENSREKLLLLPGTQLPNELGLFDMLGNVMEWCLDKVDKTAPESRFRQVDAESADLVVSESRSNVLRILRGSSIWDYATEVRASEYSAFLPSYREGNTGFRVARTLKSFPANR